MDYYFFSAWERIYSEEPLMFKRLGFKCQPDTCPRDQHNSEPELPHLWNGIQHLTHWATVRPKDPLFERIPYYWRLSPWAPCLAFLCYQTCPFSHSCIWTRCLISLCSGKSTPSVEDSLLVACRRGSLLTKIIMQNKSRWKDLKCLNVAPLCSRRSCSETLVHMLIFT